MFVDVYVLFPALRTETRHLNRPSVFHASSFFFALQIHFFSSDPFVHFAKKVISSRRERHLNSSRRGRQPMGAQFAATRSTKRLQSLGLVHAKNCKDTCNIVMYFYYKQVIVSSQNARNW